MHYISANDAFIAYLCGIILRHGQMKTNNICQSNVPYTNSDLKKVELLKKYDEMVRNLINMSIDEPAFPYLLKFADVSSFF